MPSKRAKKKTPLPDAILKDKEFLRMVDILIDCRSSDPEKASCANAAATEMFNGFLKLSMRSMCSDPVDLELLKGGAEGRKKCGWKLISPPNPATVKAVSSPLKAVTPHKGKKTALLRETEKVIA